MAVISLDFPSTATWPSDKRWAVPPGADQVQRTELGRAGAAQRLAVDGHVPNRQGRLHGLENTDNDGFADAIDPAPQRTGYRDGEK